MAYETTYRIPWTLELTFGSVTFVADCVVSVDVDVDRYGDVSKWEVRAIGTTDARGQFRADNDVSGYLDAAMRDLQADADGSFDRRVQRAVDEDEDAPRPRSDRAEHGTYYHGGAL